MRSDPVHESSGSGSSTSSGAFDVWPCTGQSRALVPIIARRPAGIPRWTTPRAQCDHRDTSARGRSMRKRRHAVRALRRDRTATRRTRRSTGCACRSSCGACSAALWARRPARSYALHRVRASSFYALAVAAARLGMLVLVALMIGSAAAGRPERALDLRSLFSCSRGSGSSSATRSRAASPRSCEDLQFLLVGPAWILRLRLPQRRYPLLTASPLSRSTRSAGRGERRVQLVARARGPSSRRRRPRAPRTGRGRRTRGRARSP